MKSGSGRMIWWLSWELQWNQVDFKSDPVTGGAGGKGGGRECRCRPMRLLESPQGSRGEMASATPFRVGCSDWFETRFVLEVITGKLGRGRRRRRRRRGRLDSWLWSGHPAESDWMIKRKQLRRIADDRPRRGHGVELVWYPLVLFSCWNWMIWREGALVTRRS